MNEENKILIEPTCIYCNKNKNYGMWLFPIRTVGIYYQHWDLEIQKGCPENKDNTPPYK